MLTTRRLFTAILFVALFVMTTREIADPDFWWHLRTGQFILETQTIPHGDPFSATNAGKTWVTHEWLAEVLLYAVYALGGFPALILAFAALITLTFAFVYARCAGKPYVAAFAVLLAAIATAITWGVRPQMLSLLLTSVFLVALDHWEKTPSRAIWILPGWMLLWVNLHSGYALGIVIVAVYLFGALCRAGLTARALALNFRSPSAQLFFVLIACLLAVLVNPNGATMFGYPFETLTSDAMQAYIQEWFSPDFHRLEFQPFAWLLLGTLAALAFAGKRVSLTQTILLGGFGYAALRSARNIPIFAIIAAPILADALWHIVETAGGAKFFAAPKIRAPRGLIALNWIVLALIVLAGSARVALVVTNQRAVERAKFPAAAVDFLRAEHFAGNVYNAYGWGGYLIWRLYPQTRVFIDGRADVYGDAFIENVFLKTYRAGADWRAPLDQFAVRVVLVEPGAPLAAQLAREPAWQKIYGDDQAVIYRR